MGAGVTVGVKIEVEIERGAVVFSKIIFFFFGGRSSISVGIVGDSIMVIFSASEISALEADLICY